MAYSTIIKPSDYMNTKLYTGNGSTNAQTGLGFQPDWVWLKGRSNSGSHKLMDAVRGSSSSLCSNNNNAAEGADYFSSFDSNGFTVNGTSNDINANGQTYVGWNWKANGQGSANTDGTVNSTYTSANTTSGFSIVQWTHTTSGNYTVGHGLNATPKMIIVKTTSAATNWGVYHSALTVGQRLILNSTSAQTTGYWGANAWNNNTFSIGSNRDSNGTTMIAYCFADVQGFSKAGSYVGNGNADGTFVYTGFKPAWLLIKDKTRTEGWYIYDGKILGYNGQMGDFLANTTASVGTDYSIQVDLVSNGFKFQSTTGHLNGSGEAFVYMAIAESPFVANSGESIPTTAR